MDEKIKRALYLTDEEERTKKVEHRPVCPCGEEMVLEGWVNYYDGINAHMDVQWACPNEKCEYTKEWEHCYPDKIYGG